MMSEPLQPLTPVQFADLANVSRETLARLESYAALLTKWNKAINLVAGSTLSDLWRRHIWDSAQLLPLIPSSATKTLLDVGSGAGFPGLVLAILLGERCAVHLCESDQRKATFLREAARATGADVTVHAVRVEALKPFEFDLISARALAPLGDILDLCEPLIHPSTQFLLLKGKQAHNELTESQKNWKIDATLHKSRSDDSGFVVHIQKASRHDRTRQSEPRNT
jgi:16S rRNA (guanine527-N7)-methyltransferase